MNTRCPKCTSGTLGWMHKAAEQHYRCDGCGHCFLPRYFAEQGLPLPDKVPTQRKPRLDASAVSAAANPQPTTEGYWWTRPADDCMWRVVEIGICNGVIYIEEMGEEGQGPLPACPWWQWVGPITPPPGGTPREAGLVVDPDQAGEPPSF